MRRKFIPVAVAGLFIMGLITATYLGAKSPFDRPTVTLLYPKGAADGLIWPTGRTWVWSVNRFDPSSKGEMLSLVVRVVHERLGKGEHPIIGPRTISKAEAESEINVANLKGVKPKDSAQVSVQLIDLSDVAIPAGKKPLRLLLKLLSGGCTGSLPGEQSVIEGHSVGSSVPSSDPKWKEGELHLQCLFIQEEDRVAIYDIVLRQWKD